MDAPGAMSSLQERPLLDELQIITEINTEFGDSHMLGNVSCLTDDEVWTCGKDRIMRLYNLQGKLVKSIQTKSGQIPGDITVTQNGELVYTDYHDITVNIEKNTQTQTLMETSPCL